MSAVKRAMDNALSDAIKRSEARILLIGRDCLRVSNVSSAAGLYRCDSKESAEADLIAEFADLVGIPDNCLDVAVIDQAVVEWSSLGEVLEESWRVLSPNGHIAIPIPSLDEGEDRKVWATGSRQRLLSFVERHFDVELISRADPVTGTPSKLIIGRKSASPLAEQPSVRGKLRGYAYHLSRKTGRRIVFCLMGPSERSELSIETVNGETVGRVPVGPYNGAYEPPNEKWANGFAFPPRASFELQPSLPSGVYMANGRIPFVHRGEGKAPVAILIPSNTAQAFNDAGGRSLYPKTNAPAAEILSFLRPMWRQLLVRCEAFVKWFAEANPYVEDTTFLIDSDLEEHDALDGVEVLLVLGRSEYWTRAMRERFDDFVDRGGRALLLCSELMYWQVRIDLARHQLYRYRDNDPHPDPLLRTSPWHYPDLRYPVFPRTGCDLWHGGFDAQDEGIGWGGMKVVCPGSPLIAGSDLQSGDILRLPDGSVWDGAPVSYGSNGIPRVEFGDSPPWRHEVIGYNLVRPIGDELPPGQPATSLWSVLRRTPESGTVVHAGTFGWCGPGAAGGNGPDSERIRPIILRMLDVLLKDEWPFSTYRGHVPAGKRS